MKPLRTDLLAIAQLGEHHLLHGALEQARIIWEALCQLAPNEPAFHLALGVVRDREDKKAEADALYARTAALDPGEPRADLNRAELALVRGDPRAAEVLLRTAMKKAEARGEAELLSKSRALHLRARSLSPRTVVPISTPPAHVRRSA